MDRLGTWVMLGGLLLGNPWYGTVAAAEEPDPSKVQRQAHLERMKQVAARIRLLADPQRADSAVKLLDEPVLRYADNTRQIHESALWIWSDGGRPSAVLAVEYYPKSPRGPRWLYEIASLSTERVAARCDGQFEWTATEPGLKLQTLTAVEPPADKAGRRLSQMKLLRERFSAHESAVVEGRLQLRPLSSPLLRYAVPNRGITDGALFAFANGTNPEVLLILEAHFEKKSGATWKFGLAQMTGGAVTAELDGQEVWQVREADPPAVRDSYVNGWLETTGASE